jgi:hypothetical protein
MAKRNGPAKIKKYSLKFKLKKPAESLCIIPFLSPYGRRRILDGGRRPASAPCALRHVHD